MELVIFRHYFTLLDNQLLKIRVIAAFSLKICATCKLGINTISPTNTATNPISVDQPYAGPAASCCSINGTHSICDNISNCISTCIRRYFIILKENPGSSVGRAVGSWVRSLVAAYIFKYFVKKMAFCKKEKNVTNWH
jgi:hypothetical protein